MQQAPRGKNQRIHKAFKNICYYAKPLLVYNCVRIRYGYKLGKMMKDKYKVGDSICHPYKPEWGEGQIENVTDNSVHIFFSNESEQKTQMFSRIGFRGEIAWDSSKQLNEEELVEYFKKPKKIYSLRDLIKSPPPSDSGVYGWYFNKLPPYVPKKGCTVIKKGLRLRPPFSFRQKWYLLYIGRAEDLKDRISDYHIKGKYYAKGTMSSLRLSLGCLLSEKLGLTLSYPPESFGKKEKRLNKWIEKHMRVAWIETNNIKIVESKAITDHTLPLNYRDNIHHPLAKPLHNLRKEFRNIAKTSVEKPRKKDFKKAYNKFVKQCKALGIKK